MKRPPSFLVIGNVVDETIVREDGCIRRHVGGVAGIMARELGRQGADVTLLSAVESCQRQVLADRLAADGVRCRFVAGDPPQLKRSAARITTLRGEQHRTQGSFPAPASTARQLAEMAPHVDLILAGMYLHPADTAELGRHPGKVVANATTTRLARRMRQIPGLAAATLNQQELAELEPTANAEQGPSSLAKTVLVTLGPAGYRLHEKGAVRHGKAPPPPEGADFIGAGDAMTAGLAWALATGRAPQPAMRRFLVRLLQANADSYRH